MNRRLLGTLTLVTAAAIALLVGLPTGSQAQSGWTLQGCWSPFPTCKPSYDIYRDPSGHLWKCKACGTTTNPGPSTCQQVSLPPNYWCS